MQVDDLLNTKDIDVISNLIIKSTEPIPTRFRGPALEIASLHGSTQIVQTLLNKYANSISPLYKGNALQKASQYGHTQIVEVLVGKYGDSINPIDRGYALMLASSNGHVQIVDFLLNRYTDPITSIYKGSSLEKACSNGHISVVQSLINRFGDSISTLNRGPALEKACTNGHCEIAELLINRYENSLNNHFKGNSIMKAALNGHTTTVEMLLNRFDSSIPADSIKSALEKASANGHLLIVEMLKNGSFSKRIEATLNLLKAVKSTIVNESKISGQAKDISIMQLNRSTKRIYDYAKSADLLHKNTILKELLATTENNPFLKETGRFILLSKKGTLPVPIAEAILNMAESKVQGLPLPVAVEIFKLKLFRPEPTPSSLRRHTSTETIHRNTEQASRDDRALDFSSMSANYPNKLSPQARKDFENQNTKTLS